MLVREGALYQSSLLLEYPWLRHGFGTRDAESWLGDYTQVKQIHSDLFFVADGHRGVLGHGDALIVSEPHNPIGVRTADCVSLIVVDVQKRVGAVIHAGWRGTASQIAAKTVAHMHEYFGALKSDLVGAIGPSIGPCCFEVGPEVIEQFRPFFPDRDLGQTIDLREANRRQLLAAGLLPENIDCGDLCTKCGPEEFHSWRRDREASGRMVSGLEILS